MKLKVHCLAVALLCYCAATNAQDHVHHIYGVGKQSCGDWIENRKLPSDDVWMLELSFVEGYLTASELLTRIDHKATNGTGIAAQVDAYCAAHPMDGLTDAAADVAIKLQILPR